MQVKIPASAFGVAFDDAQLGPANRVSTAQRVLAQPSEAMGRCAAGTLTLLALLNNSKKKNQSLASSNRGFPS